jgi:hypothetical protein
VGAAETDEDVGAGISCAPPGAAGAGGAGGAGSDEDGGVARVMHPPAAVYLSDEALACERDSDGFGF